MSGASKFVDRAGMRCGKLAAWEKTERDKHGNALWRCHCDCGNEHVVRGLDLRRGRIRSCGHCGKPPRGAKPKPIRRPHNQKLTPTEILQIYALLDSGQYTLAAIGKKFGVCAATICGIRRCRR